MRTLGRRHTISLAATLLAVLLLFSGCGGQGANSNGTSAPQSNISGYYSSSQTVSGGKDIQMLNLREIQVKKQQADTVISMEFREGSLLFDMEEKPAQGVPKYETQWIPGVNRLVLNIYGLIYWDYRVYDDELMDTPIHGIFDQTPVNNPDMLTKLYINLKDNVVYRLEEENNILRLYLRVIPGEERTDYYVTLNAFDEFTDGEISEDEGLLPTLCSDKVSQTLISQPFATEKEAQSFLDEKKESLLSNLPGKNAVVVELKNSLLPDYDEKGALNAYVNAPVTRKGSVESSAPVLISNGRILCWRPDGMAYVFVTPFFIKANDGREMSSYENIYVHNLDTDKTTLLTEFDYTSITKAEFSDDGRYLAFLEGEYDSNRLLCIYDFENSSKQVATASEAGYGFDNTVNFTWGSGPNEHTIYAITGKDASLQLMYYTLTPTGPMADTLVEDAFTQGSMGYFDGKLYYSQSSFDTMQGGIFSYDPLANTVNRISEGSDFQLNRKTGTMAIVDQDSKVIELYNVRSKVRKQVFRGKSAGDVLSFIWSGDGSTLFYTVYKYAAESQEKFNLTLYQYNTRDNQSLEITDMVEGQIIPSDKSSEVLMIFTYSEDARFVPITYVIGVNQ